MNVLISRDPCKGDIILDISTKSKEAAAYLYMFRYCQKHTGWTYKMDHAVVEIEKLRINIGNVQQDMKEKILLHGKESVRNWLTSQRRTIADLREAIKETEALMPVWAQAAKGGGSAAKRLFVDRTLRGSPFQIDRGSGPRPVQILKVCDARGLRVPDQRSYSPSVIMDDKGFPAAA